METRSLRVLVVEPDHIARSAVLDMLRPLGCDAVVAVDGREALVEALVRRPSVILMESWLPLVNAPALCEILRRDSQTRTVPIVALAGDPGDGDVEHIRRAGATSVLIKPVPAETLRAELLRLATAGDSVSSLVASPSQPSPPPTGRTPGRRIANSKRHIRCTTTNPPSPPPALRCPTCDGTLVYERSHLGGVSERQAEQWDDYTCPTCGALEFRHRTRKLRERTSHG